jgi:2-dehydropantoate 2-reductase
MRFAVLGMGGVGGLIAGSLARGGDDVAAIVRPAALASYPATIEVSGPEATFTAPVRPVSSVAGPLDVLWIATKATQLEAALAEVRDASQIGAIVPLLNGVSHVDALRARFGAERVVAATITVESERVAPGRIALRSRFAIVGVTAADEQRLHPTLERLAQAGITTRTAPDETTLLWRKLVFLAPLALTTSAAAAPFGEVSGDPERRAELEACVGEACAVAVAAGAQVDAGETLAALLRLAAAQRSSMQKDVAAGFPPELDAIAGPILSGAETIGLAVPATRALVARVRASASTARNSRTL